MLGLMSGRGDESQEPIPVEPVPVEPVPVEPVPVVPIPPEPPYARSDRLGPPRLVRAIGVWSIVVAGVSLIGGPVSTLTIATISTAVTTRATMVAAAAAPPTVVSVPEVVDPGGFAAADRAATVSGLSRSRLMTPAQQLQLDELLAESGREVITVGSPVDAAVVSASVTSSGQLGTLGTADAAGDGAPVYFVLANGRLELTDTRAVYFPGDGQPAVRAVAYALPDLPVDSTVAPARLSDEAIRSTVRTIVRMNGGRPKTAQTDAILTLLRGSNQQVVTPTTDGTDPACQVTAATTTPDGTLSVQTFHGGMIADLAVTPAGQVSASLVPATAAVAPAPTGGTVLGAAALIAIAQFALAIYLLVIGILTVRWSPAGRLLHWIYVGVKLPLAAGGAIALWHLGTSTGGRTAAMWFATPAAAGLIYAVALILALLARSVRDYYRPAALTSAGTRYAPW